ncbi:nucleotidyltransferase family protein [Chelativorans sp. Marseille-P2723]|uniref:nucleotidyltransferase family protein n=1 Tax=Chelativorans sp. Marseille-P2723 TaxID=2709133 RepID=UPI001FF0265F|nr:nucleotidyltransferase family protein [Chelativorans sp. Marseille-P2723]
MSARIPKKAMVLAAGLGLRMRPLTQTCPKPLITVGGRRLIDWGLDALERAGVQEAVVNVHYLPDKLIDYLACRQAPRIAISDERDRLLDSGGAVARALPLLGPASFLLLNADTFWIDGSSNNLNRLTLAWDAAEMDILMLLADPASATGHTGKADFTMDAEGRLKRAGGGDGLIYAGAAIVNPALLEGVPAEPHSLNVHFDRAIEAGRLYGLPLDGHWITVGTPEAIPATEALLRHLGISP